MNLEIGAIIKNLRTQHKITQEQLATFLGVTPQAISRWEAGNGYPDIETLPSIANFFSVSTDELFGTNRTEKEKRRDEIYLEMQKQAESGEDNEETILTARKYVAEFPSDERIQMNLADSICRAYMWNENPDLDILEEAEKLYLTLIDTTKDSEFRYELLESLSSLYAVGYKDNFKVEQTLRKLPTMAYCREQVGSTMSSVMKNNLERTQDYIEKLTDSLGTVLEDYIINSIPNDSSMWDEKIAMFEKVISLYEFVFGDNMLFYHTRVAGLYRVIATYKVAQRKYDDTLSYLEKMCYHIQEGSKAKSGDKYTSHFMNTMTYPYPEGIQPFGKIHMLTVHNDAWYVLNGKLNQDRYDPIREMPRFKKIVDSLEQIAH